MTDPTKDSSAKRPQTIAFNTQFDTDYGRLTELMPGVRRIVANNPGPYTFKGTATFVAGRGEVAVIDPGPNDDGHIDALFAAMNEAGESVTHILITHTHPDHSPGAARLKALTGAKTYAWGGHPAESSTPEDAFVYPRDAREPEQSPEAMAKADQEHRGDFAFHPDVYVSHEDTLDVGPLHFEAIHTPGHIANHLCFAVRDKAGTTIDQPMIFTGDHVMGWSTSVISPPGGNLADYLASLELTAQRPEQLWLPTHGAPIVSGPELSTDLLSHRKFRTEQVLAQLNSGQGSIPQMVETLYSGIDKRLYPAAARSLLAHLFFLIDEGIAGATVSEGETTRRLGTNSNFFLI